jgi:hypothetical protein
MEELRIEDYLEYDETSSTFVRWKKSLDGKTKVGREWGGGNTQEGYKYGVIRQKIYTTHRVVYYLHYGIWSDRKMVVNHKDSNRSNNSIDNLEMISLYENVIHKNRSINSNNTSGHRGISQCGPDKYLVLHRGIWRGRVWSVEDGLEVQRLSEEYHQKGLVYKVPPRWKKGVPIPQEIIEVPEKLPIGVRKTDIPGRYSVMYKGIRRGRKDSIEECVELYNKCVELDKQGIVYTDRVKGNGRKYQRKDT